MRIESRCTIEGGSQRNSMRDCLVRMSRWGRSGEVVSLLDFFRNSPASAPFAACLPLKRTTSDAAHRALRFCR